MSSDAPEIRPRHWRESRPLANDGPDMAKQAPGDDANINTIIAKYRKGQMPRLTSQTPLYGDFSNVDDYLAAQNRVLEAQANFRALPAKIRDHCRNDPAEFIRMCLDPSRRSELEELGLVEKEKKPAPPASDPPPSKPSDPDPGPPKGAE